MVSEIIAQAYAKLVTAGRRQLDQITPQEMHHRVQEILLEEETG